MATGSASCCGGISERSRGACDEEERPRGRGLTRPSVLRKILVVDDSPVIQHVYELFLSRYRTRLVSALDGGEALERLAREPEIDLILLDINMPVMNGVELLQRLKRAPAYERIPVIVITTQGREEDIQRCLALGADAYLLKPFKAPELDALIERTTGERPT